MKLGKYIEDEMRTKSIKYLIVPMESSLGMYWNDIITEEMEGLFRATDMAGWIIENRIKEYADRQ